MTCSSAACPSSDRVELCWHETQPAKGRLLGVAVLAGHLVQMMKGSSVCLQGLARMDRLKWSLPAALQTSLEVGRS